MANGWIGVDLDGTLAHYEGWRGELHIGPPIAPMVERVKTWLAEGREVRIFTARISVAGRAERSPEMIAEVIGDWTERHIGRRLPVTCSKDFGMIELWDDRCRQVESNTGRALISEIHDAALIEAAKTLRGHPDCTGCLTDARDLISTYLRRLGGL